MRSKVFRSLALTIHLILAIVLSVTLNPTGGSIVLAASGSGSGKVQVDIEAGFNPADITISPGTLVEWRNKEKTSHTVTSDTGLFDSGALPDGGKFSFTFTSPGTYSYQDKLSSYKGVVRVTGAPTAPPPVPPPGPAPTPPPGSGTVRIGDNSFTPNTYTVAAGATVTWTNNGQRPHSVTSNTGVFDSGVVNPGQSFSFTFTNSGTFSYRCIFHSGQTGSITVTGGTPSPNPAPAPTPTPTPTPNPTPNPTPGGGSIQVGDNTYTPASFTTSAGTTVTWTNGGQVPHSVTSDTGLFNSNVLMPGQSFSFTFTNSGTFSYHCMFHSGQAGSITVTGGSPAPNPTPTPTPTPNPTPNPTPGGGSIQIGDNTYTPASFAATAGTTVTWTNGGQVPHSVTADAGLFNSNVLMPGQSFSFTFTSSGTFPYHCMFHPSQTGTVTVTGGSSTYNPGSSSPVTFSPATSPTLTALEIIAPLTPNLIPLAPNPRTDSNVIPYGLPASAVVFDVIAGNVTGISPDRMEWRIGTQPVFVYTSSSTRMAGNPAVGDSVEVLAYRTLNPGPLVADQIETIPRKAPGTAVVTRNYQLTGKVTTPKIHTWTIGGTQFIIDGDPPADISPGLGGLVTVRFSAVGIFLPSPIPVPAATVSPAPASGGSMVQVQDNTFSPNTLTIPAGTTVTWTNGGQLPHTVTSSTGLFDSGMLMPGQSFSFTLNSAGDFGYHCIFHSGQTGNIIVNGVGQSPAVTPVSSSATTSSPVTVPTTAPATATALVPAPTPTPAPAPATATTAGSSVVQIGDNTYTPDVLTASDGATVTWTNGGKLPHTVTSNSGLFDSGLLMPGQSFSFTFTSPGDFKYHCIFHTGQNGTVTVTGKIGLPSTAAPSASTTSPSIAASDPPAVTPSISNETPSQAPAPAPQPSPAPGGDVVQIGDNTYTPGVLTAFEGTTVTWTNGGKLPHSVTSNSGLFDSGMLMPGQSFSFTFTGGGDFSYHCIFHSDQTGAVTISLSNPDPTGPPPPSDAASSLPYLTHTPETLPEPAPAPYSTPAPASVTQEPSISGSAVRIGDNDYAPDVLNIAEGQTVTWTNVGQIPHTVTSYAGLFGSMVLIPGQSFTFTFPESGDFSYRCIFHPGQAGTVTVLGGRPPYGGSTAEPAPATTTATITSARSPVPVSGENLQGSGQRDGSATGQTRVFNPAVPGDSPGQTLKTSQEIPTSRGNGLLLLVGMAVATTFTVSIASLMFFGRRKHR